MQTSDGANLERELQGSADALSQAVSELPESIWQKAPAGRWSGLECVEHIALVADGFSRQIVTSPMGAEGVANPEREADLYRMVHSRERAISAPQVVQPRNRFTTLSDAMAHFRQIHTEVLNRLKQVEPHLRSLQVQYPVLGLITGYEAFLTIGAHTMRHVAQIHELAATEGVTVAQ